MPATRNADAGVDASDGGIGPASPPASGTRWTWEDPLPTGAWLRGVWMAAPDDVWAVGEAGTLLHYDGTDWSSIPTNLTVSLEAVWGTGSTNVWAAGEAGILLHYDGIAWSQIESGTTAPLGALSGTAPDDVWAASASIPIVPQEPVYGAAPDAVLLHFDGRSWTRVSAEAPTAVAALARDDVWVGTASGLRHFDGTAWSDVAASGGFVRAIAGVAGGPLFALTESPTPCSPKSGVQCPLDTLLSFDGNGFAPSTGQWTGATLTAGDGAVWAFLPGFNYAIQRYDDAVGWVGLAQAPIEPPATGKLGTSLSVAAGEAWIVGISGRRMHYAAGILSEPEGFRTEILLSMSGSDRCDLWAVGNASLTLHRGCDGTWSSVDLVATGVFSFNPVVFRQSVSVAAPAPDDVWIAVSAVEIAHYDGARWTGEAAPALGNLYAAARGDIYFASQHGLFHRDAGGWAQILDTWITGIWSSSPTDVWVVDLHQVHHFDGKTWSVAFSSELGPAVGKSIWGRASDDVWVARSSGQFLHWNGNAWSTTTGPLNAVYDIFVSADGDLWAFGWTHWESYSGWGLFRFDGKAWTEETPPTSSAILLFGTTDKVFAHGQGGAILSRALRQ